MLHVIVFSKDRPLQLHAYLESMSHYASEKPDRISVLTSEVYTETEKAFPDVQWHIDGLDFDKSLRHLIVESNEPYLLFGCDDVVFFRPWSFLWAKKILDESPDILGVSLRLGSNTRGSGSIWRLGDGKAHRDHITWRWTGKGLSEHWCYPFEVMGTIYRRESVMQVLHHAGNRKFRYPGDLEIFGVSTDFNRSFLAMDRLSCCAAHDVNRVQSFVGELYSASPEFDSSRLRNEYQKGKRLNWLSNKGIEPTEPFLVAEGWCLT